LEWGGFNPRLPFRLGWCTPVPEHARTRTRTRIYRSLHSHHEREDHRSAYSC
jgi:hypothetical protein